MRLPSRLQGPHVQRHADDGGNQQACNKGSIFAWKDGIVTRGVLIDIPRLKGVEYLEPGTRIYPEDSMGEAGASED